MTNSAQQIRRSQFVLVYGPGALIEGRNGSRIIPRANWGIKNFFSQCTKYEISDKRMEFVIKSLVGNQDYNIGIYALPSNASLNKPDFVTIYETLSFPLWKVCYNRKGHEDHNYPILYNSCIHKKCPVCESERYSSQTRFVAVCGSGHLDDVPWDTLVHRGKKCNKGNPNHFFWKASGGSLSNIKIECPLCHSEISMQEAYKLSKYIIKCSSKYPENNPSSDGCNNLHEKVACQREVSIMQKQSSALHIPITYTLVSIPKYYKGIRLLLQDSIIFSTIKVLKNIGEKGIGNLEKALIGSGANGNSVKKIMSYVKENGIDKLLQEWEMISNPNKTFLDFIHEEFGYLLEGQRNESELDFSMGPPSKYEFPEKGFKFDVYPVDKIKTVTVQRGYVRMPYVKDAEEDYNEDAVWIGDRDPDPDIKKEWYPGFEGIGEGIFLTFQGGKIPEELRKGLEIHVDKCIGPKMKQTNPWGNMPNSPLFLWFHTLSHALIREISLFAGYSLPSLRERVYTTGDAQNGGILIYTPSTSVDGGMGGLESLAEKFDDIIKGAIDKIRVCSNDPLCYSAKKEKTTYNGAACYACLMLPETSCEHRNRYLDRHIIF